MSSYFDNKHLFSGTTVNQYGSHMVMENVMKERKTKYVNIDTKFRDEYNYNLVSDYNITLPQRLTDVRSMSVVSVEMPMTFYNISAALGNNAILLTKTDNTTRLLDISDGQYDATSIMTALNARKNGLGITDMSFSLVGNRTTITSSTTIAKMNFDVDATGNFAKNNFKSRLGWLLGFRSQFIAPTTTAKTSDAFVDMTGSRYLYLVVDEFSSCGNQSSFISPLPMSLINKNVLARISLDKTVYPFLSVLPANNSDGYLVSDTRSYTGKVDIQKLNVQIVNENGVIMNLNGADFSFCLRFEHE
jgi:hypothetical protein